METFRYDNRVVRNFAWATLIWGLVGMSAGLLAAVQLFFPEANLDFQYITFGRLRPLHTNAVIFAFVGNGMFMGIYYSLPRLCKTPMFSRLLSQINFWGWNAIIVAAAVTLPLGFTTSKEYAELEWPIDIAITLVWVAFTINLFGTIIQRREKHLYVAIWFYIATALTVALLHIVNSMEVPAGWFKSVLPHHPVSGLDVLLPAKGRRTPGVFVSTLDHPLLGADLYLYLGRSAPSSVYSPTGLGAVVGHGLFGHADCSFVGRHAERVADPAWCLGQGSSGADAQVHGRGGHGLRYGDARRTDLGD